MLVWFWASVNFCYSPSCGCLKKFLVSKVVKSYSQKNHLAFFLSTSVTHTHCILQDSKSRQQQWFRIIAKKQEDKQSWWKKRTIEKLATDNGNNFLWTISKRKNSSQKKNVSKF
jgi:hypothetical protein